MPLSTEDEILFSYAALLHPELIKTAWDFKDLLKTFGLDFAPAAISAAVGAGAAAVGGTSIGAGAVAGAAGMLVGGVTLGGIILTALTAYGLIQGIRELTKLTDNNIDGLIKRLEALDPDAKSKGLVDEWLKTLDVYKKSLDSIGLAVGTDEEKSQKILTELQLTQEIVAYIKTIQRAWPEVKKHLTDWEIVGDPAHAEKAINQTVMELDGESKKLIQELQANTQKVIQEHSKQSGQDYVGLAKEIDGLYQKVTSLNDNKPPEFDTPSEQAAWSLVNKLLGREEKQELITPEEYSQGPKFLLALKISLQQAIDYLSKKPAPVKSSVKKPAISKRALTLADGKKFGPATPRISIRNPVVMEIQKSMNGLRQYTPDQEPLEVDGIFGQLTSGSLIELMENMPALQETLSNNFGITKDDISNYNKLSADKISGIYKSLEQLKTPGQEEQNTQQQQKQQPVGQCQWGKDNMNDNEIESCLRAVVVEEGQERVSASDWLDLYNYTTPQERAEVVRKQLSADDKILKGNWTDKIQQLVWDIKKMHPTQPGPGQFDLNRL